VAPRAAESDGPDAVRFASAYGLTPFVWQEDVLDDWLGRRPDGRWAATTCGLDVSRQNGKNAIVEVREFFGAALLGEKIIHTAHQVKTAREAFLRVASFFEDDRHPEIKSLVREVRRANGQEAVTLTNGGQIRFIARSGPSGRGMTADVLILDEAQDLSNEELAALLPMVSASPLGNPQVILTGTPPDPEKPGHGEVWRKIRAEGESKRDARMSWTDYGIPDGPLPDLSDIEVRRELVMGANPSLIEGLFDFEVAEREFSIMPPEVFARERLSWWGDGGIGGGVFATGAWAACRIEGPPARPAALGIAADLDQTWLSLAACSRDKTPHLGAVLRLRDTTPFISEVARIAAAHRVPVVIDPKGPASFLIADLEAARVRLTLCSLDEFIQASADLTEAVDAGAVSHGDYDDLNAAVRCATWRYVSDRRTFGRKAGDISMLEAASLAFWGARRDGSNYDIKRSIY
jgi:hypothetical protein